MPGLCRLGHDPQPCLALIILALPLLLFAVAVGVLPPAQHCLCPFNKFDWQSLPSGKACTLAHSIGNRGPAGPSRCCCGQAFQPAGDAPPFCAERLLLHTHILRPSGGASARPPCWLVPLSAMPCYCCCCCNFSSIGGWSVPKSTCS